MTTSSSTSSRSWEALNPPLAGWILRAVSSMGFQKMTPVQASTISLVLGKNVDVVVEAVTGSGKTLAFLIPAIERVLRLEEPNKKHHVSAIIISPTRELARQIYDVLLSLLGFHGPSAQALQPLEAEDASVPDDSNLLESARDTSTSLDSGPRIIPQLLVGGSTSTTEDLRYFLQKSPNILIATPGRLVEILSSPHVHCPQSTFDMLIMDEADRLLDLGFKDDMQKILGRLPKQRRTGLFSASVTEALDQIIRVGLRNPVKIIVKVKHANGREEQKTPTSLQMTYLTIPASHKIPALVQLLERLEPTSMKTIVYLSTCAGVDYYQHLLSHILSQLAIPIITVSLHGKHPPNVRNKNFSLFTNNTKPSLLLTTDIAARGLDIPQVDLVVQLDAPCDQKNFIHRAGRSGRQNRKGLSVIFLHPGREEDYISFLQIRKTPIIPLENPHILISPEDAISNTTRLRNLVKTDRALHDKGQRAFVSWVRAYSKHHAASIFRMTELDWADLGNAWALLKLPVMPEIKAWDGDRSLGESVDWTNYKYKDKAREKNRQNQHNANETNTTQVNEEQDNTHQPSKKVKSWNQNAEARQDKIKRREQRQAQARKAREAKWSAEEREKQADLDRMINEVKKRGLLEEEPPFEGFADG